MRVGLARRGAGTEHPWLMRAISPRQFLSPVGLSVHAASMTNDSAPSKFQILAGQIESQLGQWGMDAVMSGPEPLYYILGILHEASQRTDATAKEVIDEVFDQMNTNFAPASFDFDAFYERMEKEQTERQGRAATAAQSGDVSQPS